jgi:hypothetical protein
MHKNKSGLGWSLDMNLKILDFKKGWRNEEEFEGLLIDRHEFLNRAAISVVESPKIKSRREAFLFKNTLNNRKEQI